MGVLQQFRRCWPSSRWVKIRETHTRGDGLPSGKSPSALSSEDTLYQSLEARIEALSAIDDAEELPIFQSQLVLHAVGEEFKLVERVPLRTLNSGNELLVRVSTVGLNPIDWKAPAFGWGLPNLPCVLGRDFVGTVVRSDDKAVAIGSIVGCISTDYRDYSKAAFQQFAIAPSYNVFRVPTSYMPFQEEIASLGVAFVTAALALGVCLGGNMSLSTNETIDLLAIARSTPQDQLPEDIRRECANEAVKDSERLQKGDWILIWGAGSSVGFVLAQLAKLAGLKVICVADAVKNGSALADIGVDAIVDRKDIQKATDVISTVTKGTDLKYGIDTVGKESCTTVQSTLRSSSSKHVVGLVGLAGAEDAVHQHKVPIKLFHEVPAVGKAVMRLLEDLLQRRKLVLPKVHVHEHHGLEGVNSGLELLRAGTFNGQRIVVPIG